MWRIIKSELGYHRRLFAGFVLAAPLVWLLMVIISMEDVPLGFFLFVLVFLPLQNWVSLRSGDRRERLQILLPVPRYRIALARVLLIVLLTPAYVAINVLIVNALDADAGFDLAFGMKVCVILIIGFSLYFVLRDLFSPFLRRIGLTRKRLVLGMTLIFLGTNLFGIYALNRFNTTGEAVVDPKPFVDLIVFSSPFAGEYGILKFVVWIVTFSALTIASFNRRTSYLD